MIALPEKFNARTPTNNIPPPTPIMEEIKEEIKPKFLIIDGNKFKNYKKIPHQTIVKGDQKYLSIASASILAKHYRDKFMINLHKNFPQYLWSKNKGYPTAEHKNAIKQFGITKHHRKSFKLYDEQLTIDF